MEEKRYYTVGDIQQMLHISRPTIYALLQKKVFRWTIVGRKYIISKMSFDTWMDEMPVDPEEAGDADEATAVL